MKRDPKASSFAVSRAFRRHFDKSTSTRQQGLCPCDPARDRRSLDPILTTLVGRIAFWPRHSCLNLFRRRKGFSERRRQRIGYQQPALRNANRTSDIAQGIFAAENDNREPGYAGGSGVLGSTSAGIDRGSGGTKKDN